MQESDKDKPKKKAKKPRASGAGSKKKTARKKAVKKPDASSLPETPESQGVLIPEGGEDKGHVMPDSGHVPAMDESHVAQEGAKAGGGPALSEDECLLAGDDDSGLGEAEKAVMQSAAKVLYSEYMAHGSDDSELVEYLLFRVGGEGYALLVSEVNEILRHQRITRVPRSALHVLGTTSLRGTIIPVINLGSLLSGYEVDSPSDCRILVLKDTNCLVGVLVEKGIGIVSLGADALLPPPTNTSGDATVFIKGVIDVKGEFYAVLKSASITRSKATMEA